MGNAFLLVIVGLLLFYVVISDKFYCIEGALACLGGKYVPGELSGGIGVGVGSAPVGKNAGTFGAGVGGVIGLGGK